MLPNGAWELPEELRMLRDTVRSFMENEVRPIEETLPHDAVGLPAELRDELRAKAQKLGLWCLRTPVEHGGAGLGLLASAIVTEEASKCKMGAYIPACGAFGADPPNVIFLGSPDQIEKYAKPMVEGRTRAFMAISESTGGSDPARAIRCRAERVGNKYVLNGSKMWITGAGSSDWGVVYARTGAQGDRGAISSFIVDSNTPGLSMKAIGVIRSYEPYELTFDNVEIPAENLLGEEGQGFKIAEKWLVEGRVPYAAGTIGVAQAALDMAIEWARQRETFGKALSERQAIQWMLADSEIELRAARLMVYQAAWKADLGQPMKVDASMAKVLATETAFRVVDRCVQIFGGLGVAEEMPLERWFRELRIKRIGEGPSEVQRMVVARALISGREQ